MKHTVTLTITSLLSILLFTFVIMLLGSLLSLAVPILHIALGVTALFSVILSARGLWSLRRGEAR